jgi:sulfate transport system permease protein
MTIISSASEPREYTPRRQWGRWGVRGLALTYLTLMIIVPIFMIAQHGLSLGLDGLWRAISRPVAWDALKLTLWTAALMALLNAVLGTITAYVLVRYEFPGKALLNAIVDLPFAIPTLVTGVMLVVLYGPQSTLGAWLNNELSIKVIFAPPGIILALLFITFPFVVRAIQPVLMSLDRDTELAAATMGAGAWTIFRTVTLPAILMPLISGTLLSFARAVGEFGAIVVVAGNIPFKSQTAAVYVFGEIESENQLAASAVSLAMLTITLSVVLIVDLLQNRYGKN